MKRISARTGRSSASALCTPSTLLECRFEGTRVGESNRGPVEKKRTGPLLSMDNAFDHCNASQLRGREHGSKGKNLSALERERERERERDLMLLFVSSLTASTALSFPFDPLSYSVEDGSSRDGKENRKPDGGSKRVSV